MAEKSPWAGVTDGSRLVEVVDGTLIRGGATVLSGISLVIRRGEHTVVLGPNGAGKTSLIRMFTLDDRPVRRNGAAALRLFDRESWDVEELRRRLGVVTSDLDATFGLGTSGGRVTGQEVALSGLFGSQGVFSHHDVTDAMREQARHALDRVEALHLASRPLNELSTGERRRVLIARALVTSPDALVLDEPTAGLDVVARQRFMGSVNSLARQGTTIILVTHHVEEIFPDTRLVVLLRGGRVVFAGPPDAALTDRRLSDLFGAPLVVERRHEGFNLRLTSARTSHEAHKGQGHEGHDEHKGRGHEGHDEHKGRGHEGHEGHEGQGHEGHDGPGYEGHDDHEGSPGSR